ncbi:hypothetical protein KJ567_05710 [Candidatus Bipolaricaulota bacterium]|nr:hypothetical protein [Candidatus Bipolaricaulota bacterium]
MNGWYRVILSIAVASLVGWGTTIAQCPADALATYLSVDDSPGLGAVQIEVCHTRAGDIDTYTYTLTNLSYVVDGCGVVEFSLENSADLPTLASAFPDGWMEVISPDQWYWRLSTVGDCGIEVGESAEFSISLQAPTAAGSMLGTVSGLSSSGASMLVVTTTGPVAGRLAGPLTTAAPCPDDAIAHHVEVVESAEYGDIQIETCLTREGELDTYTYTLTNLSFEYAGCGISEFGVDNEADTVTWSTEQPVGWTHVDRDGDWSWEAPSGDCGILVGESASCSITVSGPTTYASMAGYAAGGPSDVAGIDRVPLAVEPIGVADPPCADLAFWIVSSRCDCEDIGKVRRCDVEVHANVRNDGNATARYPVVFLTTDVDDDFYILGILEPGAMTMVTLRADISSDCPSRFTVELDPYHQILECDELNNTFKGTRCCD